MCNKLLKTIIFESKILTYFFDFIYKKSPDLTRAASNSKFTRIKN